MNIANFVTSIRLVSLVPLFSSIALGNKSGAWLPLFWYLFAGATDIVDGFLARRYNLATKTGAMLDLLADRLLTFCVVLGLAFRGNLDFSIILCGGILIARDFLVAGLNETFPNQMQISVDTVEKTKVWAQFIGLGLLISPNLAIESFAKDSHFFGMMIFAFSTTICTATIFRYSLRARSLPNDT